MERAGNVRGRNHDRERFALSAGCKTVILSPGLMPSGFHIFRIVTSFHSGHKFRKIVGSHPRVGGVRPIFSAKKGFFCHPERNAVKLKNLGGESFPLIPAPASVSPTRARRVFHHPFA